MKTFASFVAAVFAVVAGAPIANAQALLTQPYQTFVVQPGATLIRETPLFAVPVAAQPIEISTVETVRTIHPRSSVRHHVVASRKLQDRIAINDDRPLYNAVAAQVPQSVIGTPVVPIQTAAVPVAAFGQGLSGQFQCVQGCAAAAAGPAFVTQNGWSLNLVNEIGQPSRAWIDWPGHIWAQSWNEGAVYSPDQMTIQFDNGTVWSKNIILVVPPVR
jgi:hypothetical protein